MNILVVCEGGLGRGFAQRCEKDGHNVKIGRLDPSTYQPDLILYDRANKEAEDARRAGFKVLGSSRWSSAVEEDTLYFSQIATSLGWSTNGVKQGTHFYISGWFNGSSFISTYASIVYRRFMAGGAGPDLACVGMVSCFAPLTAQTKHIFLDPLEKMLKKVNHRGVVHIHALVNGPSWCVKEVFTNITHPLSLTLFENSEATTSEMLLKLFDETSKPVKIMSPWGCGVQLSLPPYPHNWSGEYHSIEGIVPGNHKHLWIADVEGGEGHYVSRGLIGYVVSRGDSTQEVIRRVYRTIGNLSAKDLQYRNDVGKDIYPLLTSLKQSGWIN